jgi:hypothetical protein
MKQRVQRETEAAAVEVVMARAAVKAAMKQKMQRETEALALEVAGKESVAVGRESVAAAKESVVAAMRQEVQRATEAAAVEVVMARAAMKAAVDAAAAWTLYCDLGI